MDGNAALYERMTRVTGDGFTLVMEIGPVIPEAVCSSVGNLQDIGGVLSLRFFGPSIYIAIGRSEAHGPKITTDWSCSFYLIPA
jgi:hypothetical protein